MGKTALFPLSANVRQINKITVGFSQSLGPNVHVYQFLLSERQILRGNLKKNARESYCHGGKDILARDKNPSPSHTLVGLEERQP